MPMTRLTKKGEKFLWTLECELVFHTLKEKLTTDPVLIIPNSGAIINDELRFRGRLCVPDHDRIREELLDECHCSKFSIHPRSNKMYRDMKR